MSLIIAINKNMKRKEMKKRENKINEINKISKQINNKITKI